MRDFRYAELVTNNPTWNASLESLMIIEHPALKRCAEAFSSNIQRTASFAVLPLEIFFQSTRNTRITANAIYKTTGRGALTLREQMEIAPTDVMVLEFAKEAGEYERMDPSIQHALRYDLGVWMVEKYLANNAEMRGSIDALFTSIVLESWLFFESLASDLWVAAVDNASPEIAARVTANQKWEKSEMLASHVTNTIANARTHPGSFRREIGVVSFQKLRSIKDYFKIAFGDNISDSFEVTAGGYIHALSAVRNLITHNAGRIDGQFAKATERFLEWKSLKSGDLLLLDGEIVKKLRNAALEVGVSLLKSLDGLLKPTGMAE